MFDKNNEKPTKIFKSKTLGEIRAEKKMKEFCTNLKAFENPKDICQKFLEEILFASERDTKMYFKTLSRELFGFIGHFIDLVDFEWFNEDIDEFLEKYNKKKEIDE